MFNPKDKKGKSNSGIPHIGDEEAMALLASAPPTPIKNHPKNIPKKRFEGQTGYVLHTTPYSETSLIIEVFLRNNGRIAMLARGARRPRSDLRGILRQFQPLSFSWGGKGELMTLYKADWMGGHIPLNGDPLLYGFYLNELLLKFLPRDDPHEELFDIYERTLFKLAQGKTTQFSNKEVRKDNAHSETPHSLPSSQTEQEPTDHSQEAPSFTNQQSIALREFEKHLLQEIGYGIPLTIDSDSGESIDASAQYYFNPVRGPSLCPSSSDPVPALPSGTILVRGQTLLDLFHGRYSSEENVREAKHLMRHLITYHLQGRSLKTRQVLTELYTL